MLPTLCNPTIISTHDLARRSTYRLIPDCYKAVFQLTTSQGGRHFTENAILILLDYFNSRPRKEVDVIMRSFFSGAVYFNSRPRKEVDIWTGFLKQLKIFQLTTSQGGRPVKRSPVNTRFIFQLTTSQGGRHLGHGFYMHCGREFQLTTSQGGRPATQPASGFDYDISTHDLARRSTMGFDREDDNLYHFNSRPRKEVDISFYPLYKKIK